MNDSPALKSILLLAANPKGTKSLRLQEEEREVKERLRLAGYGKVPISSVGATRPKDIQQALLDFKPQIVHFSGHGAGEDGLIFEDAIGQEQLISSEALADLFKLFSNCVECVILNACYSKVQAQSIAQHIDYVVGMSQSIGDRAAIEFTVGFYNALGAGESIDFAYELGCNAIHLEGISGKLIPVLIRKADLLRESMRLQHQGVIDKEFEQNKSKDSQVFNSNAEPIHIDRSLSYVQRWNSPSFDKKKVIRLLRECTSQRHNVRENFISQSLEDDDDLKAEMVLILNFLEEMSILIHRRLVDESLLRDFFNSIVITYVTTFYSWIQVRRKLMLNDRLYERLTNLYENWHVNARSNNSDAAD